MITEDFIRQAWRRDHDPVAHLLTLTSDADPAPIHATDWPGGLTSDGTDYPHFPFRLAWAGAGREAPFGEGRLTIANVDRRIEEACDAANDPPVLDLQLVRIAAPDTVESAILGARVPNTEGDASQVSAVIRPRDFGREPACAKSATPASTPALF